MDDFFLGDILVGFIAGVIVTPVFTTAHFLWVSEETKGADRLERKRRGRRNRADQVNNNT